jgi:hypothetical protein
MKRFLALALLLVGCGSSRSLPDGGREALTCETIVTSLVVRVVDAQGNPVDQASVTAVNTGTGKAITAHTNGNGVTNGVTQDLGEGTATVKATLNNRVSDTKQVSWVCGDCLCTVQPDEITLTLSQ